MPKLILHVGTGKTGTTSIQTALKRNQAALAALGYHVVESRRSKPLTAKHKLNWSNPADPGWAELAAEAARVLPTGRHLILSNEDLWRLDPDALRHFGSVFTGYEPMVVMYVREQVEWIQSSLLQKQKKMHKRIDLSSTDRVDRWIRHRPMDYLALAQGIESALGAGCLQARSFHRSAFQGGDLLVDFFHTIGIAEPRLLDLAQEETNTSLATQFAALLARTPRRGGDGGWKERHVRDLACRLTANGVGSRYFMTRQRVEELRATYRASNAEFARRYLKNSDALPMKDVWIGDRVETVEEVEAQVQAILRRLLTIGSEGWHGLARTAPQVFVDGWQIDDSAGNPAVAARPTGSSAVINFRLPYRRRSVHQGTVRLALRLSDDRPLPASVAVNQHPAQPLDLASAEISFPVDWTEPIDEVRLDLGWTGDPASLPSVVGLDILSLQRTPGADDDDLDSDGDDDED